MAVDVAMLKALGTFSLVEIDPPRGADRLEFHAYLTKAPVVVAGYGGWSRVARPRDKALTEWVGRDSVSIQCEFLVDALDEGEGSWTDFNIRSLESLAGVDIHDPEPPLCRLRSDPPRLMPHGYERASHVKWFVDTLNWDADSIITGNRGNRIRAAGTLVVTQHVKDERLGPVRNRRRGSGGGSRKGAQRKRYTVKRGDTLSKIAARKDVYGDAKKWRRIATANKIRDPKNLKVGRELIIP